MKVFYRILVLVVLFAACEKKNPEPQPPVSSTTSALGTTGTPPPDECKDLPPPPQGFEWIDSTLDANRKISAFFYNPANSQEVMVIVEGDQFGGNQLFAANPVNKTLRLVAQLDEFLPSINTKGWIVFSNVDKNIFKIKASGDSLTQLVGTNAACDPKWDHTGRNFYYLQDEFSSIPAQLIKADAQGHPVINWPHRLAYTVPFHKSDKIVILRNTGNVVTAYLQDFDTPSETPLFSGPFTGGVPHFQNLCVDATDERLYWSNQHGIFSYHIATKKTDTLFRNCETLIFSKPMAASANEITFSKHTIRTSHPYYLVHRYAAIEYNVVLKETREIKVF